MILRIASFEARSKRRSSFSFPFLFLLCIVRKFERERERKKSDAISTFDDSWIFFFFSFFFEDSPRCKIFDLIPVPERALH